MLSSKQSGRESLAAGSCITVTAAPSTSRSATQRLAEAGIEASVGSTGDSYDDAVAEAVNALFKAEVIYRRGPWKSLEAVELAVLVWVALFNNRRLLGPIGHVPPAEFEAAHYAKQTDPAMVVGFTPGFSGRFTSGLTVT
jgi:transposase InsO family protein